MDNSDIKPSTIMLIAGGAVLLISTFLDWFSVDSDFVDIGANAWDTDVFGIQGIFCALIGLLIGGGVAARQFGNVSMPERILGFDHDQIHFMLSLSAVLITLGLVPRGDTGIGLWLALIASVVMIAGAFMDMNAAESSDAAPTQF